MTFLTVQEPPVDPVRAKEFEAAFTPFPVAHQALHRAAEYFGLLPRRHLGTPVGQFLDPAAGAGVWCQAARKVFGSGHFAFAVEARAEESACLKRNADDFAIADFLKLGLSTSSFDMAATNPPFSFFAEYAEECMRVADRCWLYAPCDISMRKVEAAEWFVENQKWVAAEFTTAGPVAFKGGSDSDFRHYSLWCMADNETKGWHRELLPVLPGHDRRWVDRPGTEVRL